MNRSTTVFGALLVCALYSLVFLTVNVDVLAADKYGLFSLGLPSEFGSEPTAAELATDRLCSRARDHFTEQELIQALQTKDKFHKLGGNYKSVKTFRDQSVDATLERLGVVFIPEGETKPQPLKSYLSKYYSEHYDSRGGYGKPLPGMFVPKDSLAAFNEKDKPVQPSIPALFGNRWVEPLEPTDGRKRWDAALGPIGPTCKNLHQLGTNNKDGYKFMCMPMNNQTTTPSQQQQQQEQQQESSSETTRAPTDSKKCQIFSVGGNDNWKFEVAMADRGCETHTFDCTLPGGQPRRKPHRKDIHFYPYCLNSQKFTDEHGRNHITYSDMLQVAGFLDSSQEKLPVEYLKIDVEGFEYGIFLEMIEQDQELETSLLPQQIQVELHWATRMTGVDFMTRTLSAGELALFESAMYLGGGYMPIHLDFNPYCSTCMEVLYFKTLCS